MATPTYQNKFFQKIVNEAEQQRDLNVGVLTAYESNISQQTVKNLQTNQLQVLKSTLFSNGHLITKQTTPPTVLNPTGTLTNPTIAAHSTDISGTVSASGVSSSGETLTVLYNIPYTRPAGATGSPQAWLTPLNTSASEAVKNGLSVGSGTTGFTIVFPTAVGTISNPQFSYFTTHYYAPLT